jgi:hypothetical protein
LDGPLPKVCPVIPTSNPQGSFQQTLVEIGSVVSEEKIFFNFIPPFSIFSLVAILVGSRDHRTQFWKRAIQGSFHQNCSILSQKVPKFELYKHNDELFNIYYGIFYEL